MSAMDKVIEVVAIFWWFGAPGVVALVPFAVTALLFGFGWWTIAAIVLGLVIAVLWVNRRVEAYMDDL